MRPTTAWDTLAAAVIAPLLGGGSAVVVEGPVADDALARLVTAGTGRRLRWHDGEQYPAPSEGFPMNPISRRSLLASAGAIGGGLALAACTGDPKISRPTRLAVRHRSPPSWTR